MNHNILHDIEITGVSMNSKLIDEGNILQISQIDFVGNRSFSNRQLRNVIKSKRAGLFSSFFTSDNYSEDSQQADKYLLEKFYKDNGFPDAKVIASLGGLKNSGESAFLTYSIYEGSSFKFGDVSIKSTVKGVSSSIYKKSVVVSRGDNFNLSKIQETLDILDLQYTECYRLLEMRV